MPRTQQVAALPWRVGEHGVEILLVTTRTTKRWLIPKGWTMDGKADYEAAAIEAYEEAGVRGDIDTTSLGAYGYLKLLRSGKAKHVIVQVYGLRVETELDVWPESHERQRQWFAKAHALTIIGEPELLPLVTAFEGHHMHETLPQRLPQSLFQTFYRWWLKIKTACFGGR
jgi:8-oxo-dGTP pyrophosphatase MutT (NUDIX family)